MTINCNGARLAGYYQVDKRYSKDHILIQYSHSVLSFSTLVEFLLRYLGYHVGVFTEQSGG